VCNAALDRSAPGKRAGAFGAEREYTVLTEGQGTSTQFCVQTHCADAEFGINSQELAGLKKIVKRGIYLQHVFQRIL
jgi:hypothetical protein